LKENEESAILFQDPQDIQFKLLFIPRNEKGLSEIFLQLMTPYLMNIEYSIMLNPKSPTSFFTSEKHLYNDLFTGWGTRCLSQISYTKLMSCREGDEIPFVLKLRYFHNENPIDCSRKSKKRKFTNELHDMEANRHFHDIMIEAGENKNQIASNKTVLALRSPVFAKMFETDMKESISGVVQLHNFSEETVKSLNHFCFNGNLSSKSLYTLELLDIAVMYDISDLVKQCEDVICYTIKDMDVAKEVLNSGFKYELLSLQTSALKFMTEYVDEQKNINKLFED